MTPKRANELITGRLIDLENRISALEQRLAGRHPAPNEVRLKEWVAEEAQRHGLTTSAIYNRLNRGFYHTLQVRRVHGRVAFIQNGEDK